MSPNRAGGLRGAGSRAFTLLEILITIALIALLSALVVGASIALVRDRPVTGRDVLLDAIAKSRRHAVVHYTEVRLSYDSHQKSFVENSDAGTWTVPVNMPGTFDFSFLPVDQSSSVLIGGDVQESTTIPYVTFYPDGGCSPFRAQIKLGTNSEVLNFDPWTCAPVLEKR